MSDLTTTMPIFIPPDGKVDEARNPPPGELGHLHTDEAGRHRGGANRPPRALILVGVFAVAVAGGIALTKAFEGNGAAVANTGAGVPQPGLGLGAGQTPTPPGPPSAGAGLAGPPSSGPSDAPSGSRTSSATRGPTPSRPQTQTQTSTSAPVTSGATGPTMILITSPVGPGVSSTTSSPTPAPTTTAFTTLRQGATGQAVATMQNMLVMTGDLAQGTYTTGNFDTATTAAVKHFQSHHASTASDKSGEYGPATDAALRRATGTGA